MFQDCERRGKTGMDWKLTLFGRDEASRREWDVRLLKWKGLKGSLKSFQIPDICFSE